MTPADLAFYVLIGGIVGWVWDLFDPDAINIEGSKMGRLLWSLVVGIAGSALALWVAGATAAVIVAYYALLVIVVLLRLAVHGR